jgi:2-polyprenyl-6-methoxyphenol hydroxylase-like FAD-dependent oxidoreductase
VEVVGAGIAGLTIGTMLARLGWSVRIHERADRIREIGAGISLRNNCIGVLEGLGVFDALRAHGTTLRTEYSVNATGDVLQTRHLEGNSRTHVMPRQILVDVLARAAVSAGAEIRSASRIDTADPSGWVVTESGERFDAELIVAADGVGSRVRDQVLPSARRDRLVTVVDRWLLENRNHCHSLDMYEYWSGRRRVGIMPAGEGRTFIFLVASGADIRAARFPVDSAAWRGSFPTLGRLFEELATTPGSQFPYQLVRTPAWSNGRVALLGDSAHGMPATLGQGAGLTTLNAHALAVMLSRHDVEDALREWERSIRDITEATQRWSMRYDQFTNHWPATLRPIILGAFGRFGFLNRRMRIADQGLTLFDRRLGPI